MTYTRENLTAATTAELDAELGTLTDAANALAATAADHLASSLRDVPAATRAALMRAGNLAEIRKIMAELLARDDAKTAARHAETSDL